MWDSRIGRWLTTDPAGQYASPYLGMGNNPLRTIDPDGGSGQDVIIHGKNDSSLTIKAPGKDVHVNVDKDFEGNKTVDLGLNSLKDLAIGYQGTTSLSGGVINGATASALINSVMFFDDTYGGYWYQFGGGELSYDVGLYASLSADLEGSLFFATRNKGGDFGPRGFEGSYTSYSGSFGLDAIAKVEFFYQQSVSQHWTVHEIGGLISADAIPNVFSASLSIGTGKTSVLNKVIPTSQRSWSDIISNQLLFNPLF